MKAWSLLISWIATTDMLKKMNIVSRKNPYFNLLSENVHQQNKLESCWPFPSSLLSKCMTKFLSLGKKFHSECTVLPPTHWDLHPFNAFIIIWNSTSVAVC